MIRDLRSHFGHAQARPHDTKIEHKQSTGTEIYGTSWKYRLTQCTQKIGTALTELDIYWKGNPFLDLKMKEMWPHNCHDQIKLEPDYADYNIYIVIGSNARKLHDAPSKTTMLIL